MGSRPAFVAVLALGAAAALAPGTARAAVAPCGLYASLTGSDGAGGSAARPFRTAQRLVQALPAGGVGCLVGGASYVGRVVVVHPVTLQSAPGKQATLVGGVTILGTAAGTTIRNLTIHGQGGARATVIVRADDVAVTGDTIDGSRYLDRNTACVLLDGARSTVVDGNRISDCTRASKRDLSAPGVFAGSSYGARISNNVIVHTVGYGISLGPNAQHSRVTHNLVDGSVGGVLLDGNAQTASSYNVIEDNVLSNAGTYNVHAVWGGATSRGNAVVGNCLWHAATGNLDVPGVATLGNIVANPRYANRPVDYTIGGGPCLAKAPSLLSAQAAPVPRFGVSYVLKALPTRIELTRLQLTDVAVGAQVDVRCARGCTAHWQGTAGSATVAVPALLGRWLPVGAAVDVRVTEAGRPGAWARLEVIGLPKGVSVVHRCLAPGGSAPVPCGSGG